MTVGVSKPSASKKRVVSNLLVMGSGQVVTWLVSIFYLAMVSNYLGPTLQGEFSRASYTVLLFGLMITLGMDTYITRTVARAPDRAGVLVTAAIVIRAALIIPVLIALYLYMSLAHLTMEARITTLVLFVSTILSAFNGPVLAAFQGHERMAFGAVGAVIQNVLELILIGAVVLLRGGVVAFAATNVVMTLSLLALNLYWMRGLIKFSLHLSFADIREVVSGGVAFWVGSVLLTFYFYIDSLLLGGLAGDQAVGIYAPATRMFAVPLFLPSIVGMATLPLLSRLGLNVQDDFARVSRKTLSLLIFCGVPATIGLATFAGPLILTIFRHKYAASVPVLVVLSLSTVPTFLAIQFYQMVVARNQQWRWTIIMAAGCIINPLLNVILVPYAMRTWHNGAMGAAWAIVATETMMMVYGIVILHDIVMHRALGRALAGALVAGAIQWATILLTAALWPPIGQTLGLVTYGVVTLALGTLPREDMALLWQTALGRVRRRHVEASV